MSNSKDANLLASMRVGANFQSIEEEKKEPASSSRPDVMIMTTKEERSKSSRFDIDCVPVKEKSGITHKDNMQAIVAPKLPANFRGNDVLESDLLSHGVHKAESPRLNVLNLARKSQRSALNNVAD